MTVKDGAMKKGLIIVESPAKIRTLKRYVGDGFEVKASVGHIKDLPQSRLGVDVENDFTPEFEIIRGKGKVVKDLKSAAAKIQDVFLATDPDREGEAIAWHIAEELRDKKDSKRFHRVLFRELTARAIKEAMAHPGELNRSRCESQLARRILDRLVGYEISPILWDKVRRGLSAGRVQSVAVRLVCDREREIQGFVPREYWTVEAKLESAAPPPFMAKVVAYQGKKCSLSSQAEAEEAVSVLRNAEYVITGIQKKERKRQPPPPFITSTLQQEAARKLRFSARKTMATAQKLYEGVDVGKEGPVGLITYMRTDSSRAAPEAIEEAKAYIRDRFGASYVLGSVREQRKGRLAQDAHEAVRPTSVSRTPEGLSNFLDKDELALYDLIWKRFVASQMSPAVYDQTQVDIQAQEYGLRTIGTVLRFPGFTVLYAEGKDEEARQDEDEDSTSAPLPPLSEGDRPRLLDLASKQHFTQPPPRFTEATLIKTLEEKGIGRPSTYAAILSTIREKEYVLLDQRHFHPTELGLLVNDILVSHFPAILDVGFTAGMERQLDNIEEHGESWRELLRRFYGPFRETLNRARTEMESVKTKGVPTDKKCEKCGKAMVVRYGRSGQFLACSGFPSCRNTQDFTRDSDGTILVTPKKVMVSEELCEKCGKPMLTKRGRFGEFLACSAYPECKNTRPISTGISCPEPGCSGTLIRKTSKRGKIFFSCSRYPACTYASWDEPINEQCPECGHPFLAVHAGRGAERQIRCPNKACSFRKSS